MQREVLTILRDKAASLKHIWEWSGDPGEARRWTGLRFIAREIRGDELAPELLNADHSLIESVRRAIKTLDQRGLIETAYIWYNPCDYDPDDKWLVEWDKKQQGPGLHCRLSDDEHAAVRCTKCIGPCPRGSDHDRYLLGQGNWPGLGCPKEREAMRLSVDGGVNT
jgi:hypothetical protein